MTPEFKCRVSADLFLRATSCQSTEQARYYLNGVQIESVPGSDKGALMIATDGICMIMLQDPNGGVSGGTAVISADKGALRAMAQVRKAPRFETIPGDNVVCVEAGCLTVENDLGFVIYIQPATCVIDGSFPDWRRVVPAATVKTEIGVINVKRLLPLAAALSSGPKTAFYRLYAEDASSPALVFGSSTIDGFGVIMPERDILKAPNLPSWALRGES